LASSVKAASSPSRLQDTLPHAQGLDRRHRQNCLRYQSGPKYPARAAWRGDADNPLYL